ncbi:conjugative transfer relaxase/helicase TraI (plasmid) [Vibrio coralliilyticus]|nr:conjugative transfer relaxase/helicase TraI [Vibrio coralliilyticus]
MEGQEVKQAELEKALSGEWQDEVIHGKRDKHRSGFDLTFSAPKSISLLALVGGDDRLLEAHNNAVKFALSELEKDVAQFKSTGEDGKTEFENSGQMLFAAVLHKTSRADDSQLHTHALAANMTRDDEGRLRALASCLKQKDGVINGTAERIYHNQKYYTALYQSQLGKDAHDLGYSLRGIGNGQFEVAEVPEKVIEQFSKRAEQIQEKTNALGFDSPATRDFAAKNTRQAKSYLSEDTLHHRWQNEMEGTGFDIHSVVAKAQSGELSTKLEPDHEEMKLVTQKTLERTLSHLSQSQTAFTLETLIEQAVSKFSIGGPGDALALKKAAEDKIAEGAWVPLDDKGQLFTTQDMIDTEKRLLGVTKGRVQNMRIPINDKALANLNLSRGNAEKINEVFNSTKQFQVVNVFGSAERVATHLLHVGSQSSRRIHIVSPTAVDKKQSDNQVAQKSHSIAEWIKNQFNPDHRHHLMGFLKADLPLTNKDVLLIDSAQKLSAPEITALSEKAKSSQSKIIFLNRTSSRQGFKSHSAMDLFSKGNVASTQWVNDKTTTAQVQLHQQDARSLAQQYANLEDRSQTQVLATTKKEVEQLTSAIRDELKDQGKIARAGVRIETQNPVYPTKAQSEVVTHYKIGMTLKSWNEKTPKEWLISGLSRSKNTLDLMDKETGEISTLQVDKKPFKSLKVQAFKSDSLELVPGDKLLATQKHRASGLKSQETYQLASINEGQLTFTTQKGESMTVEKNQLKDAPLQYGYVSTTNQLSQEHSHLMVSGKSYGFSKNLLQELTQSAQQVDIYSDNLEKTEDAMKKHEYRPSAITRVLDANPVNDRFVSALTEQELRRDLSQVLGDKFEGREGSDPIGKAVGFAISHISEREAGFTQKELVMEAIRYAFEEAGQSVTKDEVTQLLAQKSDVLSAEFQDGTRWTTKEAIDTEHRIINGIKAGQSQTKPYASMAEAQAFLNNQSRFTQGQKDSVSLIATSKDRFIGVQGLAGTGKSTMLETGVNLVTQALSAGTQQPSKVVGLAPTHAAVSELKEKGIEAQTLESFLTDIRRGANSLEEQKDALFLLDESSMVSNRQAGNSLTSFRKLTRKPFYLGTKSSCKRSLPVSRSSWP